MLVEVLKEKKYVIYGAGVIAKAAIIALKEQIGLDNINLVGCAVANVNINVAEVEGIKVYSLNEIVTRHKDIKILLAVRDRYVDDIVATLSEYGILDYQKISFEECINVIEKKWLKASGRQGEVFIEHINREEISDEDYLMFLSKQLKKDILSFEVNFADHCNLNCQSCNHFSPLAEKKFIDKVQYEKDLKRISELFGNRIGRVMLLGGEPLLNPDIVELLYMTRRVLPTATLYLYTNGLLFPKMGCEFWNACKETNIAIKVTEYPLDFDYDYWFRYGKEHGVDMDDENPETVKTTYRLPLKAGGGLDAFKNYAKCYHANQCVTLRDGRLYTCPIAAWNDYLNRYFNKNFPEKEQNSIDIYKAPNADCIMRFLQHPIKMCEYCDIYKYEYNIPWKVSRKEEKEWIDD